MVIDGDKLVKVYPSDTVDGLFTVPRGVKVLGSKCMCNCYGIKAVVIPDTVHTIEPDAMTECLDLEVVTFSDGVLNIGEGAFYNCLKLEYVFLPKYLKCIEKAAFYKCENLKEIMIPDEVISIGALAFSGCSNLTNVVIGSCCKHIDKEAFSNCFSLEDIVFKNNTIAITIHESSFDETPMYNHPSIRNKIKGQIEDESCLIVEYKNEDTTGEHVAPLSPHCFSKSWERVSLLLEDIDEGYIKVHLMDDTLYAYNKETLKAQAFYLIMSKYGLIVEDAEEMINIGKDIPYYGNGVTKEMSMSYYKIRR